MSIEAKPFTGIMDSDSPLEKVQAQSHTYARNGHFRGNPGNYRFENTLGNRDVNNPYLPIVAVCPVITGLTTTVSGTTVSFYFIKSFAAVTNYTINLKDSSGTNIQTITTTNNSGVFNSIAPGTYTVQAITHCASGVDSIPVSSASFTISNNCIAVSTTAYNFPDAVINQPYSYTIPLLGTPPFFVSPSSQSWLNYTISGNNLVAFGTPPSTGTLNVSAIVNNACGNVTIADTITVNGSSVRNDYQLLGYLPAGNGKSLEMRCCQQNMVSNQKPIPFSTVISVLVNSTKQDGSDSRGDVYSNISFVKGQTSVFVVGYTDGSRKIISGYLQTASPDNDGTNYIYTP